MKFNIYYIRFISTILVKMTENTVEQTTDDETIDGFIYDGICIGLRGPGYEMKIIWIPSKQLIVDDRGHVNISDEPYASKAANDAMDQYLKQLRSGMVQGGKKMQLDNDELKRRQDEAQQKAMVPIKVSLKIVEELENLVSQQKAVQETLNEIIETVQDTSAQLF